MFSKRDQPRPPASSRRRILLDAIRFASILGGLTLAGCAGSTCCSGGVDCPTNGLPSAAQLLYPIPGATNVPDDVGVLVYELPYISGSGVPISLQAGNGGVIATSPTQLPSPLPSPARTPFENGSYRLFAVALPPLKAGTVYSVSAPQPAACTGSNGTIGTFSTR